MKISNDVFFFGNKIQFAFPSFHFDLKCCISVRRKSIFEMKLNTKMFVKIPKIVSRFFNLLIISVIVIVILLTLTQFQRSKLLANRRQEISRESVNINKYCRNVVSIKLKSYYLMFNFDFLRPNFKGTNRKHFNCFDHFKKLHKIANIDIIEKNNL